jgi:diguanylate cyclase
MLSMAEALLGRISDTIASALTTEELTRPLLTMLELVTGLESTYLTRVDQEAGVQSILYARNSKVMQIPEGLNVPWDDTLCKRALDEGRPFTEDASECWGDPMPRASWASAPMSPPPSAWRTGRCSARCARPVGTGGR